MGRQFRIRVYGKQRKDVDPALSAQVVILFGRQLHQQRHNHQAAQDATTNQGCPSTQHQGKPDVTYPEPPPDNTPPTLRNDEGELS